MSIDEEDSAMYVIGVDFGTESGRAVLVDVHELPTHALSQKPV